MIIDLTMRFSWVFYVVFPEQKQHSAATSLLIAFGEVFRRFVWNFFRVENEHMTNASRFTAAKGVLFPFSLSSEAAAEDGLEAQQDLEPRSLGTENMESLLTSPAKCVKVKGAETLRRCLTLEKRRDRKLPNDADYSSDSEDSEEN